MSVYKDEKRGTWFAKFYYTDWQGQKKQTTKRGFQKKKDAQEYEQEFLNQAHRTCDMTLSSLVDLYLEDMETRLRPTTLVGKKNIIQTKFLPHFGKIPVNQITSPQIRQWQALLIKQGYSETYLKRLNNQLSALFNYAMKYYDLPKNPVRQAGSMGKSKSDLLQFWTVDEFKRFIVTIDQADFGLAYKIMFWGGLRIGEVMALTPEDITESKNISVTKSLAYYNGEKRIYPPKTKKSNREIPIPDFLYQEIREYLKSCEYLEGNEQIFQFSNTMLRTRLKKGTVRAELPDIRVHDLRHSHASLLIEMNEPILLISERLGHESVETTLNTYAHLYPEKGVVLAEALEKLNQSSPKD